jgi:hypothetical protein
MSTLTKEAGSPVSVAQVLADFRFGLPRVGTVFMGAGRHRVQVYRIVGGLGGKCKACTSRDDCTAISDAIRAIEILVGAWERPPFSRVQARIEEDLQPSSLTVMDELGSNPYDGLARDACEADLEPIHVPSWAYDEQSIRRPVADAEIAQEVWYELQQRLNRLFGGGVHAEQSRRLPVHKYYRASWELDRGMTYAGFELGLAVTDKGGQPNAFAP